MYVYLFQTVSTLSIYLHKTLVIIFFNQSNFRQKKGHNGLSKNLKNLIEFKYATDS